MRKLVLALCAIAAALLYAQEGHPLSGTWSGEWGVPGGSPTHLTLVMSWDGKTVSGVLNPGPNSVEITQIRLNTVDWTVDFEAAASDQSRIAAEGKIEDLGSAHRRLTGIWQQGSQKGEFRLTRD